MFGPVGTTPYDLRFRLFGIPVTVSPWFWLAGLITGWQPDIRKHPDFLLIWIGCFFVSILVHEMGHALTALAFGWPPEVYLYGFGGLAVYRPTSGRTTGRSILISFAGPAAGFLLIGFILLLGMVLVASGWPQTLSPAVQDRLGEFLWDMTWINVAWGLVNLVPVLPLDGGRIAEALFIRFRPWDGPRLAVTLSVVVAVVAAVAFYLNRDRFGFGTYPAFFFGLLAMMNIQSLQQPRGPW
jgi:stage IV sporulation protein FB